MSSINLVEDQLKKVEYADLSHFDRETMHGVIPKRLDIKLEEDNCYLIQLHRSFFNNQTIALNWNAGSFPPSEFLKIDISKKLGKMVRVTGVTYKPETPEAPSVFWNGWLSIDELTVIKKL